MSYPQVPSVTDTHARICTESSTPVDSPRQSSPGITSFSVIRKGNWCLLLLYHPDNHSNVAVVRYSSERHNATRCIISRAARRPGYSYHNHRHHLSPTLTHAYAQREVPPSILQDRSAQVLHFSPLLEQGLTVTCLVRYGSERGNATKLIISRAACPPRCSCHHHLFIHQGHPPVFVYRDNGHRKL
jgi:hypothetical protein